MKKWVAALAIPVISGLIILFVTKVLENNKEIRKPKIIIFEAYPETINLGEKSTLRWKTQNATQVTLNGQLVELSGNKDVEPQRRATFKLTVAGEEGQTVSETKSVDVKIPLQPKIINFLADPPSVKLGKRSTLHWETQGAIKVLLEGKSVALSGNKLVKPQVENEYALVAINKEGQQVEVSIHVKVMIPLPPPRITKFEANPESIFRGEKATLHWETQDAREIMLDGDLVSSRGDREVTPKTTTTYGLTAKNEEGVKLIETRRIEVKIPEPAKITKFGSNPPSIMINEKSTLYWETRDATEVELNGHVVALSGNKRISPKRTTTYELLARNKEGGTATATTEVEVEIPSPPQIIFFSADPDNVSPRETSKLSWSAIDATEVTLEGEAVSASGYKDVTLHRTTKYILVASNRGGKDTADVTVEVIKPPKIVKFYADPHSIWKGDTSKLVWETRDATEVSINREGVSLSGEKRVSPDRTTTYTLIAKDKAGRRRGQKSSYVEVKERPGPHQALLYALTPRDKLDDSRIRRAIREVLESGNQENAKHLLAKAGYPNGISLDLDLSKFRSAGGNKRDAQIMAAKLSRAGIQVRILDH